MRWPAVVQCAVWVLLAGVLVTFQLAIVRHIADDVHVFEIVFFRCVFGVIFILPLVISRPQTHLVPKRPGLNVLCGTLAFIANVCMFFAAKHMPLADITAIMFVRPIFAALAAALVLGEALRGNRVLAIIIGLVGTAIIVRPGLVDFNIGMAFVAGVLVVRSWNPLVRRVLSKVEHPDTVAVWNVLTMLPLAAIATYFVWTWPTPELLVWMALVGALETLNQRVLSRAYMQGDAIVVTALHYTRLPIAAAIGFVFFGDVPEIWIWVGALVILVSALILARGEMSRASTQASTG